MLSSDRTLVALLKELETHLREGRDRRVGIAISKLKGKAMPRKWRLPYANLCMRAGLISQGLRLLTPIVRDSDGAGDAPATPSELAEYAILLQRCGAIQEALSVLKSIDPAKAPTSNLYRAICHASRWEYDESIPVLDSFIENEIEPYQVLVGRVNKGAALLAVGELAAAETTLTENIQIAREHGFRRLEGNSLELLSQLYMFEGRFEHAQNCLSVAKGIFEGSKTIDAFLVRKCQAFFEALRSRAVEPLVEFRSEAVRRPHPESVRECDFVRLMVRFDQGLFDRLSFGSPFPGYRKRLERWLAVRVQAHELIVGAPNSPVLDLSSGEGIGCPGVKAGSAGHRVLEALSRDFYRPARIGSLFDALFPGEYFNVFSSPARVRQALRRTRTWLEKNRIPLAIDETRGAYSLRVLEKFSFKVPYVRQPLDSYHRLLSRLRAIVDERDFTAKSAREHLRISSSAFHRFIVMAMDRGDLECFGAGPRAVYSLARSRAS